MDDAHRAGPRWNGRAAAWCAVLVSVTWFSCRNALVPPCRSDADCDVTGGYACATDGYCRTDVPSSSSSSSSSSGGRADAGCHDGIKDPGQVCYRTAVQLLYGALQPFVVAWDYSGDGVVDLVSVEVVKDGGVDESPVHLFLGTDGGIPERQSGFATGGGACMALAEDVDGDGRKDLLVGAALTSRVWVAYALADGGFNSTNGWDVGFGPCVLGWGDVSGDGWKDLVALEVDGPRVAVLLGGPGGALGAPSVQNAVPGMRGIIVADLDGDQRAEVVVGSQPQGTVTVYRADGTGTLTRLDEYHTGTATWGIALGDVSRDGIPDIVAANAGSFAVSGFGVVVMTGRGDATFDAPVVTTVTTLGPYGAAIADFDSDGLEDIAITSYVSGLVTLYHFTDTRELLRIGELTVAQFAGTVLTTDLNADGVPDIVVAHSTLPSFPLAVTGLVSVLLSDP